MIAALGAELGEAKAEPGEIKQVWTRLVVCSDPAGLVDALEELGVVAATLPELDHFDEHDDSVDKSGYNRRAAALEAYAAGALLAATPRAVEQLVPDLAAVVGASIVIKPGDQHDLHALVDKLVDAGYRVAGVVE